MEHCVALIVLLFALVGTMKVNKYSYRWLFGFLAYSFLLVLGSALTQFQYNTISCDWKTERAAYRGIILESPLPKEKTMACKVEVENKNVLLYLSKDSLSQKLRSGDEILFYAQIEHPQNAGNPYEFDYASYLFRQQVSGIGFVYVGYWQKSIKPRELTLKQKALECRDKVLGYYRVWGFSGEELAVLSALTVGYKEELSDELRESYSVAGVSHILALSGLHVAFLWGLLNFLMKPLDRGLGGQIAKWIVSSMLLWSFAFIVGLAPSVVRAVVMCMLVGLGHIGDEKGKPLNTLAVAAFFMLLYNPFYLFDVSFQLSFIAVASILLLRAQIFALWPVRHWSLKWFWGTITVSTAAQLGTAPLIMYYFSTFSVYFLLANLIVALLIPLIIYLSVLLFPLSFFPSCLTYAVIVQNWMLRMLNDSTFRISHLPSASIGGTYVSETETWILYILIIGAWGYGILRKRRILIGMLATLGIFFSLQVLVHLPQKCSPSVIFYNVHNCPAIHFIESEKSSYLLTGRKDSAYYYLRFIADSYWKREKMATPHLLSQGYESHNIWSRDGIVHWRSMNICMMTDNRWRNKTATHLLDIDYMYLCKGYKGKIAPLQKLFRIKTIVLDASLGSYKSEAWKDECKTLGLEFIDMSSKGSFRILL